MTIPGFVFRTLHSAGYCPEKLLAGTGLTEQKLADPDVRVEFPILRRLLANAHDVTEDHHLGFRLGLQFEPTFTGLPAYTALSAQTFGEGLDILSRFFFLTFPAVELRVLKTSALAQDDEIAVSIRTTINLGDLSYFSDSHSLAATDRFLKSMLRSPSITLRGKMMHPEPETWSDIASMIGFPIVFNASDNALILPASLLHQRLPGADPVNHARLKMLCEKQAAIAGAIVTPASRVRTYLENDDNIGATFSQTAAALGYSERSLRRALRQSGTSFKALSVTALDLRARDMLANTSRPVKAIAHQLGFETPSNFARSFKTWTGSTPSAFRQASQTQGGSGRK